MSDNDDTVEPVKITATIPRRLADALADVHDDKASRRSDTLGKRGFSTDVSLAVDANRSRRPVRRALRELRDVQ